MKIKIKIYYTITMFLLCQATAFAQKQFKYYPSNHEAAEISILLNKKEYLPYEPILAEIQIKNISDVPQQFGPLDFFSLNLRYRIFKDSLILERYFLWRESYSIGWGISRKTATQPNELKKEQVILNHYIDFKGYKGKYVFELGYPIQGEIRKGIAGVVDYKTGKKTIKIKEAPAKDTAALKLFEPNFNKLMDGLNFSKKELDGDSAVYAFNKIIESYPNSYLSESAGFYKAFYFLQKYTLSNDIEDIRKADKLFLDFINKYPDTVFKGLVAEYLKSCKAMLGN
jgi:hypothetical protein